MNKSLFQIVKAFETFATSHQIIEDFDCNVTQKNFAQNWKYPMMFVNVGNAAFSSGEVRLNMDVYFLDMLAEGGTNYVQILSDTLTLCNDFYSIYNDNEQLYGFYFTDEMTASPIQLPLEDDVIGYKLPITVQVKMMTDETRVPI